MKLVLCLLTLSAFGWGKIGHRVIADVSEKYLKEDKKKIARKMLGELPLASAATWADEIKSDPVWRAYGPWHYVNIPKGKTYETSKKNPRGDIITALKKQISILKNKKEKEGNRLYALNWIIHLIGDLHQPMHTGYGHDRGGNDHHVKWFGRMSNLHRVWDEQVISLQKLSYSEISSLLQYPSQKQAELWKKGNIVDWMEESRSYLKNIYNNKSKNLGYPYSYKYYPIIEERLIKAGIRLAHILNESL